MKINLLFILLLLNCFSISAQTEKSAVKKKTTHTHKKNKSIKLGKNLSESERDIMTFSTGKKQKPRYAKNKNGKLVKVKVVERIKVKQAPMYNPIVSNGKTLTGNISSRQGFRICIYNGSIREEAFKIKQDFSINENKLRSYIVYNRPNYKIKVGDYADKKIATKDLKRLIQTYPSSFITPDIVTVKNFEVHSAKRSRNK